MCRMPDNFDENMVQCTNGQGWVPLPMCKNENQKECSCELEVFKMLAWKEAVIIFWMNIQTHMNNFSV